MMGLGAPYSVQTQTMAAVEWMAHNPSTEQAVAWLGESGYRTLSGKCALPNRPQEGRFPSNTNPAAARLPSIDSILRPEPLQSTATIILLHTILPHSCLPASSLDSHLQPASSLIHRPPLGAHCFCSFPLTARALNHRHRLLPIATFVCSG